MKCFECGTTEDIQQHHVVPKSRGGTKTVPLCYPCHQKAHGSTGKGLNHSKLTKEGIARARARGVKFGNPKLWEARIEASKVLKTKANNHCLEVGEIISMFRSSGLSFAKVAQELNGLGVKTARGRQWYATTVSNSLERYKKLLDK